MPLQHSGSQQLHLHMVQTSAATPERESRRPSHASTPVQRPHRTQGQAKGQSGETHRRKPGSSAPQPNQVQHSQQDGKLRQSSGQRSSSPAPLTNSTTRQHKGAQKAASAPWRHSHSRAAPDHRAGNMADTACSQAQQPHRCSMALQQRPGACGLAATQPETQPQYLLTMYAAFDGDGGGAAGTTGVFNGTVTKVSGISSGAAQPRLPAAMQEALPARSVQARCQQAFEAEANPYAAGSARLETEVGASPSANDNTAGHGIMQASAPPLPLAWRENPAARSTRESSFYSVASRSSSGSDQSCSNQTSDDSSSGGGSNGDSKEFNSSVASKGLVPDGSRSGVTTAQAAGSGSRTSEADNGQRHLLDMDDEAEAAALADQHQ